MNLGHIQAEREAHERRKAEQRRAQQRPDDQTLNSQHEQP